MLSLKGKGAETEPNISPENKLFPSRRKLMYKWWTCVTCQSYMETFAFIINSHQFQLFYQVPRNKQTQTVVLNGNSAEKKIFSYCLYFSLFSAQIGANSLCFAGIPRIIMHQNAPACPQSIPVFSWYKKPFYWLKPNINQSESSIDLRHRSQ